MFQYQQEQQYLSLIIFYYTLLFIFSLYITFYPIIFTSLVKLTTRKAETKKKNIMSSTTITDKDIFRQKIYNTYHNTVLSWDQNTTLLQQCRTSIYQSTFYKEYIKKYGSGGGGCCSTTSSDQQFIYEFVQYFKNHIMIWCNQPPCQYCCCGRNSDSNDPTTTTTTTTTEMIYKECRTPKTIHEINGQASRVEVYTCNTCQKDTCFPRYNNIQTLYEMSILYNNNQNQNNNNHSHRVPGRCGEYTNFFGFCCRAMGYETRYIFDYTDHVWVEVYIFCTNNKSNSYSNSNYQLQQWCMIDPCEGVMNEYSMYENGWGKQLNYIIAISNEYVIDVTCLYTRQLYNTTTNNELYNRRRQIIKSEYDSRSIVQQINTEIQQQLLVQSNNKIKNKKEYISNIQERYQKEQEYYQQYVSQLSSWDDITNDNAQHVYQHGRISGSDQWKSIRNENGNNNHNTNNNNNTSHNNDQRITNWNQQLYPSYVGKIDTAYDTSYCDDPTITTITIDAITNTYHPYEIIIHPSSPPISTETTKYYYNNIPIVRINHVPIIDQSSLYYNKEFCESVNNGVVSIIVLDEHFVQHCSSDSDSSSSNINIDRCMGGCVLQNYTFTTTTTTTTNILMDIIHFLSTIPYGRIIIIIGRILQQGTNDSSNNDDNENDHDHKNMETNVNNNIEIAQEKLRANLGPHFNIDHMLHTSGMIYVGQLLQHEHNNYRQPDWSYCSSFDMTPYGIKFVLSQSMILQQQNKNITSTIMNNNNDGSHEKSTIPITTIANTKGDTSSMKRLKTFRNVRAKIIVGRVPDSIMSLSEQLTSGYQQKRMAFLSYMEQQQQQQQQAKDSQYLKFYGYTTKNGAPIYLLGAESYPLIPYRSTYSYKVDSRNDTWNTFLFLPSILVPEHDLGIIDDTVISKKHDTSKVESPKYDIPIDQEFFHGEIGSQLLVSSSPMSTNNVYDRVPTTDVLHNARLVAYYFSAHWCGPCRSFTPILVELYTILKNAYPSHGLEIIFVSSDRDEESFKRYYNTMPWVAIPYDQLSHYKQKLSSKYNVRGIPALLVLDTISGQVVVPIDKSRSLVAQTCQAGTDELISTMFTTHWLSRIPSDSQQLLELLATSYADTIQTTREENKSIVDPPADDFCPYLVRIEYIERQERIKQLAMQLVDDEEMDEFEAYMTASQLEELSNNEQIEIPQQTCLDGLFERIEITENAIVPNTIQTATTIAERILRDNDQEQLVLVLNTIHRYFKNCYKEPWNPKFRQFQLRFKVADNITKVAGCIDLMMSCGFAIYCTDDDYVARIPISINLEEMKDSISSLCTSFNLAM